MTTPIDVRFNAGLTIAYRIQYIFIKCENARVDGAFLTWYNYLGVNQSIISPKFNKIPKDKERVMESYSKLKKGLYDYTQKPSMQTKDRLFNLLVQHEELLRLFVDKYGLGMVEEASSKGAVK